MTIERERERELSCVNKEGKVSGLFNENVCDVVVIITYIQNIGIGNDIEERDQREVEVKRMESRVRESAKHNLNKL